MNNDNDNDTTELMRKIRAGFALKGTTLHKWVKKEGLVYQNVYVVLATNVQTLQSNALRKRIIAASGANRVAFIKPTK